MKTLKTVDDFISFYEAIPDKRWCTEVGTRIDGCVQHCATGHLMEGSGNADRLRRIWNFLKFGTIEDVNDGKGNSYYWSTTPKGRILCVLNAIKLAQK